MALNIFSEYERRFATEADLRVAVEEVMDRLETCGVKSLERLDEVLTAEDQITVLKADIEGLHDTLDHQHRSIGLLRHHLRLAAIAAITVVGSLEEAKKC